MPILTVLKCGAPGRLMACGLLTGEFSLWVQLESIKNFPGAIFFIAFEISPSVCQEFQKLAMSGNKVSEIHQKLVCLCEHWLVYM